MFWKTGMFGDTVEEQFNEGKDCQVSMEKKKRYTGYLTGVGTGYLNKNKSTRYKTLPLHTAAMIIEPAKQQSEIFQDALKEAGYEPTVVSNEIDAIRQLQEIRPSLILLNSSFYYCFDLVALIRAHEVVYRAKTWIFLMADEQVMNLELMKMVDLVLMRPIGFAQMRDLALRFRRCVV